MPAIVRVKRRIDEEPLKNLLLNGKKRRLNETQEEETANNYGASNDDGKEEISTVLKFAGTIQEPDNNVTTQFARRIKKNDAQDLIQNKNSRKVINATERARQETRQNAHENRFRVVNLLRTTLNETESEVGENETSNETTNVSNTEEFKSLTIVDIEKQTNETENNTQQSSTVAQQQQRQHAQEDQQIPADSDTGYVYDLYLPDDDVEARNADLMDENYLSVRAFDDLLYQDAYNDAEDEDYDSEDSNREDYFTNDYPDEDENQELHSANEYDDDEDEDVRHMRQAVEKFIFDDDDEADSDQDVYNDASSDDDADYYAYEDPYIQSIDTQNENFVPDVDSCDVQGYRVTYASYHKRLLERMNRQNDDGENDNDEDEQDDEDDTADRGKLNRSDDLELYHSANEQE